MIFGTMGSYIKQRTMFIKFQIKKQQGLLGQSNTISPEEVRRQITSSRVTTIQSKLKAGKELTTEEFAFLRENAPELYKKAIKIQREREEYEKKLEKAKSKKEVEKLHNDAMNAFVQEADGIRKSGLSAGEQAGAMEFLGMRMAAIQDAHIKFRSSEQYHRLPKDRKSPSPTDPPEKKRRLHSIA